MDSLLYLLDGPNSQPSTTLGTPADNASISDSTPDLTFTGTDLDADTVDYQVQIDTATTFDSQSGAPSYIFGKVDFETGSLPLTFDSQTTTGGATAVIDSTSKVTGADSLKLATSTTGTSYLVKDLGSNYSEGYFQFKIMIPTAFAFGTSTVVVPLHLNDSGANAVVELKLEDYGDVELVLQGGTLGYTDTTVSLTRDTVHKVEIYYKVSATVGEWKIWINDDVYASPYASGSGLNTGTTQIRVANFGNFYTDGVFTNNIYLDEFIVDESFIGAGGSTPTPLIDAYSTGHTGFSAGASHPTASGAEQTYTVQSALSDGTYYWRVRAIDPTGSNTYGTWSAGDSTLGYDHFHLTASSGTNASVTQVAGSLTLTGNTQAVATTRLSSITQVAGSLVLTGNTQAVASKQNASITQVAGSLVLSGGTQVITTSSIVNASITQVSASLLLASSGESITDSYSESNYSGYSAAYLNYLYGQTFTGDGSTLSSAKFWVRRFGTTTGNVYIKIYNISGTSGTTGVPTGSVLATSDGYDISTIDIAFGLVTFTFSGAEKITLANGTDYAVVVQYDGADSSHSLFIGYDASTPTDDGNYCRYTNAPWTYNAGWDLLFYIYGESSTTIVSTQNASITQVAETLALTGQTQAINATAYTYQNASVTQVVKDVIISVGTQVIEALVKLSASISQVFSSLSLSTGTQVVASVIIASANITQVAGAVTLTGNTQAVSTSNLSSIAQSSASLTLSGNTQSVSATAYSYANGTVAQVYSSLTLSGSTQTVLSTQNTTVSQVAGTITVTGGTQTIESVVYADANVGQVSQALIISGGSQSILAVVISNASISQVSATLSLTGGTQVVNTVEIVAISQTTIPVIITPNAQIIASKQLGTINQLNTQLTLTGGTQGLVAVRLSDISQSSQELSLTTGEQAISTSNYATVDQVSVFIEVSTGNQSTGGKNEILIDQLFESLTLSTGTQEVVSNQLSVVSIAQISNSLTLSGNTQAVTSSEIVAIDQITTTLSITPNTQAINAYQLGRISQISQPINLTGGTQVVSSLSIQDVSIDQQSVDLLISTGTSNLSTATTITQLSDSLTITKGSQTVVAIKITSRIHIKHNGTFTTETIKVKNSDFANKTIKYKKNSVFITIQ